MRRPKRKRKATLLEFQRAFPDEASCARYLFKRRWPEGFICPDCGTERRAAALKRRAWTYECLKCGRQTSLTAGTAMHRTKQPLTVWFWAAHLMATHSNGISALQLKDQLGLSYKVAWLLVQKLRRAMVDPDREKLEGLVEIDQTEIPYRTGDAFFDQTKAGKIIIVGAVRSSTTRPAARPRSSSGRSISTLAPGGYGSPPFRATTTNTSGSSSSPTWRAAPAC
jgi:predicted RNA-binding Zn-ribbon protein involved in translation (DUF1610 family)